MSDPLVAADPHAHPPAVARAHHVAHQEHLRDQVSVVSCPRDCLSVGPTLLTPVVWCGVVWRACRYVGTSSVYLVEILRAWVTAPTCNGTIVFTSPGATLTVWTVVGGPVTSRVQSASPAAAPLPALT
jgi:hypothetical protein